MRSSNSFSFKNHEKRSLRGSFLRARRGTVCRELKWALLSAAQPKGAHRGHRTHHARHPAPRSLPLPRRQPAIFLSMAVPRRSFFAQSQRRQLKSTNTNTTTLMFSLKVTWLYITSDTYPIDSRARGVGWVAWFGLPLRERPGPTSVGSANKHGGVPGRSRPCLDHRDRARPARHSRRFIRSRRTATPTVFSRLN